MPTRIVACGGEQLYYPALTRYVLGLTGRPRPKIPFVPTASGDDAAYLLTFCQAFAGVDCEPSHLLLFNRTVDDIDGLMRAQDVVMVDGGNTANMLAIWRFTVSRTPCATYAREIAAGLLPGIALDDGVAARYEDERLIEIVSARPQRRAFRVDVSGEHPLEVRAL